HRQQLFMASSLVFLLLLAAGAASAADWCPEGTSKFSQADREFILNAHNSLRSRIALGRMTANGKSVPQAANMEKMEWDCDLEQESQKWSESTGCAMTHSPTSASYGENIYRNSADKPTKYTTSVGAEDAITRWENEYNTCEFTSNVFLSIAEHPCTVGHATQMAWAASNKLGCGVMTGVECGKDQFGRYPTFIVCRYSPRGNWKHSEIYKAGSACSQCPEETNCESETGLCVKEGAAPLITTTTVVHSETTTAKASAGENTTEDPELGHNICPEI
ncbi:scl-10, partial [Pristionchus pacificus]